MPNLRQYTPPLSELQAAGGPSAAALPGTASPVPLTLLLLCAACFAWGYQPAVAVQPTILGMLWAGLYLAGYLIGGTGRGRFATCLLSFSLGYLSWQAIRSLTDLAAADSLLLVAVFISGGWAAAQHALSSGACGDVIRNTARQGRCTIWDIGFVTTVVACVVHAVPRLESPPVIWFAVAAAVLCGLLCSWLACVWAWKDDWNWRSMAALMAMVSLGVGSLCLAAPAGLTVFRLLQWVVVGPLNVIATQATVVLAIVSLWRWERSGRQMCRGTDRKFYPGLGPCPGEHL